LAEAAADFGGEAALPVGAAQPGRIGSGTSIRASNSAASTALVPTGRSTPAQTVPVATSTTIVRSARAGIPDSNNTNTSIEVMIEDAKQTTGGGQARNRTPPP
jgi:hypothetical protein